MVEAHDMKNVDPNPRASSNDPWSFHTSALSPSLMDTNSHTFTMFANQMPGYYTPGSGGTNSLFHSQAGDLHTPGLAMGLGTPLSLPTSASALHPGPHSAAFHGFQPHFPQHMSQHTSHLGFPDTGSFQMHQQQSFPPHHFTNQPSYDTLENSIGESPVGDMQMDLALPPQHHSPDTMFHPQTLHKPASAVPHHPSGDQYVMIRGSSWPFDADLHPSFRYHATLNAPTAMIKHSGEIPITYLNKGQAYTLNVVDTHNQQPGAHVRYRTFVRVSFEDEQQRERPAACWQLWKEGRGTNEAHHRGGRLQAVEYVESGQLSGAEDPSKPRIELESASFDGFCVTWSPPNGTAECPISVRFNFLSTDFSHSKGVKGIPVRLCAKTEMIPDFTPRGVSPGAPEVCYCKVKLFRDHGAERKLSNDVAHVKKTIDKLNQQVVQMESGVRDQGKRKRGPVSKASSHEERPGKMAKHHRRTWSMSSITSTGARGSAEEDLHMKLSNLQDMFISTRPASVLYLRGALEDDPDLHPVKMGGDVVELVRHDSGETTGSLWDKSGDDQLSSVESPTPSHQSPMGNRRDSTLQQPTPLDSVSRTNSHDFRGQPQTATMDLKPSISSRTASPSNQHAVKVKTRSSRPGAMSGWIEAVGIDPSYQSPSERTIKPVACFYIQPRSMDHSPSNDSYYRAIYLTQLSLKSFVRAVASKCDVEPTKILRTVRVNRQGLHILFGDDDICELPEGQDMSVELSTTQSDSPVLTAGREWDLGCTDVQCDGDLSTNQNVCSTGYELRLLF